MSSQAEENYLKAIFKICERNGKLASTNSIAKALNTSPASVTDMIKRLDKHGMVNYEPYKGVHLTPKGAEKATLLIRKHRLWEVFLVEKLHFSWDEVHEIAEQLEHIQSALLVERLDEFLDYPKFDPHGDPIPDSSGNFEQRNQFLLSSAAENCWLVIVGVSEHSPAFLQHLTHLGLGLGTSIRILERYTYDGSTLIEIKDSDTKVISQKVGQHVYAQLKS